MSEDAPTGAIDQFKGKLKEVAGEVTGQDDLAREGRLEQAEVEANRRAVDQAARADEIEEAAEVEAALRENELEAERLAAELDAKEQRARAEAAETEAEQRIQAQAKQATRRRTARRKRAAARTEQTRKQSVSEKAKATEAETLDAERAALLERERAVEAKAAAREVGDAAGVARARRRSPAN